MKKYFIQLCIFFFVLRQGAFARSIEAQIDATTRKGQKLVLALLPLSIIAIGYLYKRGKSEAPQRLEQTLMGVFLVTTAFGWAYYFK